MFPEGNRNCSNEDEEEKTGEKERQTQRDRYRERERGEMGLSYHCEAVSRRDKRP